MKFSSYIGTAVLCVILGGCDPASGKPTGTSPVVATTNRSFSAVETVHESRGNTPDAVEECPVVNGMKKDEVFAILGEPKGEISSGRRTILVYAGGQIELIDGSVTNLAPGFSAGIRAARMEAARQAEFEALQKAKGLVLFDGSWITSGERERLVALQREQENAEQMRLAARKREQAQFEMRSRELTERQYNAMAVRDDAGRPVDHSELITPGKITVVDFYADWCGPCNQLAPYLDALAKGDSNIVLKKVNIENWRSQIAQKYNVKSVPNVRVFDRKGRLVGSPNHSIDVIRRYVEEAKGRKY